MSTSTATAVSHPNIAFIKYWGNRDKSLRLPDNGSISMNLEELTTQTQVTFDPNLPGDIFDLNGHRQTGQSAQRVVSHLNLLRGLRGIGTKAYVKSENNFPEGAGIASSASAFAALTVAGIRALGIELPERDLSRLARRGSGSASRSIPNGFVEWYRGASDIDSYAVSIARPDFWELSDLVVIVDEKHKLTGSSEGHELAKTSALQSARVLDADKRIERCREAIQTRDFALLAETIEMDCNMMHAVMMTSNPPIFYWNPYTIEIITAVHAWRKSGIPVAYTIDAGPNVHLICDSEVETLLSDKISSFKWVKQLLIAHPGGPARLL
jgi:diphosphomevalonate decarboxylase